MKQSLYDRVDEHDNLSGGTATYDDVHGQGLWHRGVHIIIYTPEREVVMQKRSPSLNYHPDEVEISVGGGVNAGESPEQAIIREVYEELGIRLSHNDIHSLGKTKSNHRTKTQLNRVYIYSYSACIPKDKLHLRIDKQESSMAFLIPAKKLRRALRIHRIKNIGKISDQYAYWKQLLDAI